MNYFYCRSTLVYYPPEVSSVKYCSLEELGRNTSGSSLSSAKFKNTIKKWYSWEVKIGNTSEAYSGHNTPLGHYTDRGLMGLGQYNSLGKYCGPHTASSVFLILLSHRHFTYGYNQVVGPRSHRRGTRFHT